MHTRTKRLGAIGTAVGLVLMASAITPAVAATTSSTTSTTSYTCSSFKGLAVTGSSVVASGLPLAAGDTISVTVDPARAGDSIVLKSVVGTEVTFESSASTSGYTFRAPATGIYSLGWSLDTNGNPPPSITWSFTATCSSTAVAPSPSPTPTAVTKPGKGKKR